MVKRFISSLINRTTWRLLEKTLLGVAALYLVYLASFSFFAVFGFLCVLLYVYLTAGAARRDFRFSFWLLQIVFLLALASFSLPSLLLLVYGLILFALLGLMGAVFSNKFFAYGLTSIAVAFSFFAVLFSRTPSFSENSFWSEFWWLFFAFAVVYWLFKEYWQTFASWESRKMRLYGMTLGVLSAELATIVVFLPLGFLNAAAFMSLLLLISRDTVLAHVRGFLNSSFVFREITLFIVISSIIFATVSWRI